MRISTVKEAEEALLQFVPKVSSYSGDGMTLQRLWPLLEAVGNPHEKLRIVHVAGTSGKTSTSYYLAHQLHNSGKKVGLTVSPHVDSITERVQINCSPLSEKIFSEYLTTFLALIETCEVEPSYFEVLIVFAFWVFELEKVDYAVIETGLGGLLDGTNVARREDKVCVITDIGYDHMNILGKTLSEIAAQKAGIIHEQNSVFMYEQTTEIEQAINSRVQKKNAKLNMFNFSELEGLYKNNVANLPEFQKRNWLLAEQASKSVADRDNFTYVPTQNPEFLTVPGRMDTIVLQDDSILIMDGAHNAQKMEAFVASFTVKYPDKNATIMLALKEGKEFKEVIDILSRVSNEFIISTFNTSQDMPAISQNPETLHKYCESVGVSSVIIQDSRQALEELLNRNTEIKIITGSFYLLGKVRYFLKSQAVIL